MSVFDIDPMFVGDLLTMSVEDLLTILGLTGMVASVWIQCEQRGNSDKSSFQSGAVK